jgi:hypothetical protein
MSIYLLHMPELLRSPSPGQALYTSVPVDHIILAPSPYGLCDSIPVSCRGVVSNQENTFQNIQRLKKAARANLQREIATWVDLAKLRHRPPANQRRRIPPGHAHISYQDISKTCPAIPTMDNMDKS